MHLDPDFRIDCLATQLLLAALNIPQPAPSQHDDSAGIYESGPSRLDMSVAGTQDGADGFRASAKMSGYSGAPSPGNTVTLVELRDTAGDFGLHVGRDLLPLQVASKLSPPLAKSLLRTVPSLPLLAPDFDDRVDMRIGLIG